MTSEMTRIAAPHDTVSGKIRALAAADYARADIARFLGKRYQHVRNVLEADKLKAKGGGSTPPTLGVAEGSARFDTTMPVRLVVGAGGALILPAELLAALQVAPGEPVIAETSEDGVILRGWRRSARLAQDMVRRIGFESVGSVEDLIADRRREAARERAEIEGD